MWLHKILSCLCCFVLTVPISWYIHFSHRLRYGSAVMSSPCSLDFQWAHLDISSIASILKEGMSNFHRYFEATDHISSLFGWNQEELEKIETNGLLIYSLYPKVECLNEIKHNLSFMKKFANISSVIKISG